MTAGEIAVYRDLLPHDDPRSQELIKQAVNAPCVHRRFPSRSECEIVIPYTREKISLVRLKQEANSPLLIILDKSSGLQLEFSTRVAAAGFLGSLVGKTCDGSDWPFPWEPDLQQLESIRIPNWLPAPIDPEAVRQCAECLQQWLGFSEKARKRLTADIFLIEEPASHNDIASAEETVGLEFPEGYKNLLHISNGFSIDDAEAIDIYGADDVTFYEASSDGDPSLVLSDLRELGGIVLSCGGKNRGRVFHLKDDVSRDLGTIEQFLKLVLEQKWTKIYGE